VPRQRGWGLTSDVAEWIVGKCEGWVDGDLFGYVGGVGKW
jgi:hypothetical protein